MLKELAQQALSRLHSGTDRGTSAEQAVPNLFQTPGTDPFATEREKLAQRSANEIARGYVIGSIRWAETHRPDLIADIDKAEAQLAAACREWDREAILGAMYLRRMAYRRLREGVTTEVRG